MDWSLAPYGRSDYTAYTKLPEKPVNYEKMLELCRVLSAGVSFLRVDLYEINSKIYFSEFTFFPGSGFTAFDDPKHDVEIGNMLTLPEKHEE